MTTVKRISISGYYGFGNTGDEAVLAGILLGLKGQTQEPVEITVLSASPQMTASLHSVKAVNRSALCQLIRALKTSDLLISGGGSLIQDVTSFRSAGYYLGVIALAKACRCKVMILGQGVGPINRSVTRLLARRILQRVDLITVRDQESADLLKSMGVSRPPVYVTADPTFVLAPCAPAEAEGLLKESGLDSSEEIIAVGLREWSQPGLETAIAAGLKTAAQSLPARFLLLTMQPSQDEGIAKRVGEIIGSAVVQPRIWTPTQMLGVLARCRLVIGMRLHALILGAAAGVPALGIVYDPKVKAFLKATRQESITLEEVVAGKLADRIVNTWTKRGELATHIAKQIPQMREAALENMRLALSLLANGG